MSSTTKICPQCGTEYPPEQRFCPTDGTPLRARSGMADLVGTVVADRYLVLETLGEGGMGRVYLAEHVRMGRKCALKVMSPKMAHDADAISRFNREAANACRITHPHMAAVYDFGETPDGVIYLAMEFVDGAPLTRVVEEHGALPPNRAAEIAKQTADALTAAHDLGIVHRDLKPDNIMITQHRDGSDCVKVVDFGIAKVADNDAQKVTKTGLVVGTPDYMSPEQLAGDRIDGRSDVYSLALVTFHMLTGTLPFVADSQQESMIMRLTDRPRRLGEMAPHVEWPAAVQTVLDRGLERDAKLRYATAAEFGRDLHAAIAGWDSAGVGAARTVGANDATAIMGAVGGGDATRLEPRASIPPTASADRTAVLPGTVRASGGGRVSRPQPQARRGFQVWVAAAGVVLVLGAGAAMLLNSEKGAASGVTPDNSATSDTVAMRNALGTGGRGGSTAADAPAPGASVLTDAAIAARLDTVNAMTRPSDELSDAARAADARRARQALAMLDSLAPGVQADSLRAYIELLRGESYFLLDSIDAGCRVTRGIDPTLLGDARRKRRESMLKSLCTA